MVDQHVYRVRAVSTGWGGAPGLGTHYFDIGTEGPAGSEDLAEDCSLRVHAYYAAFPALFPSTWKLVVNPVVDVINTDNGELVTSYVTAPGADVVGAQGGAFGPQVAMYCGNLITADVIDGHRVKGRTFLGPLAQGADADGTPIDARVDIFRTALLTLMGGTLDHPSMTVWSRRRGVSVAHPTGLGGTAHTVTAITVKDTFAILRSRRQ